VALLKACKNPTEIEGTRNAHKRDAVALARFLSWIDHEAPSGHLTEIDAVEALESFRRDTGLLKDVSFPTISGAGPNGAIVHYRASEATNRPLAMDSIYLVDSGGQYPDGTTDVTRTVIIGTPTAEMRDRFTRVLKGHVALARALFPEGTRGSQLDTLARQYLWRAGLDYAHGTGHGVGAYLAVHEGPQRISPVGSSQPGGDEPLKAGMFLSNEPGYYKTGEYGIRIENLVLIVPREIEGAEKKMLGFETLTFVPIDRNLIDLSLLNGEERRWVDDYHAQVLTIVGPQLEGEAKDWLQEQCRPL
jgi:Xaa-Pro aminopeptidase